MKKSKPDEMLALTARLLLVLLAEVREATDNDTLVRYNECGGLKKLRYRLEDLLQVWMDDNSEEWIP